MKIIHITQFLGIGGLEKIIFHLIGEQLMQGHEVSLYVYDYDREWVPFFRESGINVITPPSKKPGIDFGLFRSFNRDLMEADIIHSHDMNPLVYLVPLKILRKLFFLKMPKLIHTTHGMAHIERVPKYKYFEKFLAPFADKIICVSKKIENLYKIDLKINSQKLITIENGIKTFEGNIDSNLRLEKRNWLISRHSLNPNLPIFLCLSRVLPLKDQKFLVEFFRDKPDYQLVIAGPASDNNYYQELQQIKTNNIFLVGSQEKVTDYNLGSDLFISASTHEGIPVAVLEAMSVETPVLVSDIPGHLTLNQYGECIATYKLNDKVNFEQKLKLVLQQKDITKTQLARKVVEEHFSVKKMVDDYLLEYQK